MMIRPRLPLACTVTRVSRWSINASWDSRASAGGSAGALARRVRWDPLPHRHHLLDGSHGEVLLRLPARPTAPSPRRCQHQEGPGVAGRKHAGRHPPLHGRGSCSSRIVFEICGRDALDPQRTAPPGCSRSRSASAGRRPPPPAGSVGRGAGSPAGRPAAGRASSRPSHDRRNGRQTGRLALRAGGAPPSPVRTARRPAGGRRRAAAARPRGWSRPVRPARPRRRPSAAASGSGRMAPPGSPRTVGPCRRFDDRSGAGARSGSVRWSRSPKPAAQPVRAWVRSCVTPF